MYRVTDYPDLASNYFLKSRCVGPSRMLRGNVAVITCFMKRKSTDFPAETMNQYNTAMLQAYRWLETEAGKLGVRLKIKSYYFTIDVPANANPKDGYRLAKDFLKLKTVDDAQRHFERTMGFDEVPLIFVYDHNARSFASRQTSDVVGVVDELSTVFKYADKYHWATIAHELLHQFGATDLYFPEQVRQCALRYFRNSIMGVGTDEMDDLNAYLIGWKNTLSPEAVTFLMETMWITPEKYKKAIEDAWKA